MDLVENSQLNQPNGLRTFGMGQLTILGIPEGLHI